MQRVIIGSVLSIVLALTGVGLAGAADLGLITGSDKGTYYQFGLDLQRLVRPQGVNLTVHPSRGSVENIYAVYQRPGVQMGIVQSDVLGFVSRLQSDPVLTRIAKKTRMVFPLYNEEVHILGRADIAEFDDLAGRRVAIGREGSGTYLTARLLFKLADVAPAETLLIDTTEAIAALKAGRVDAMFYVAGYPVKLFSEDVNEADRLKLVPILHKSITEFYPPSEVPAKTYAWQREPVSTVAVKAVLVSFDFRKRDCATVGRFAQLVSGGLESLKKTGHAKWKAVDLNYQLRGWEQYDCVRRALGKGAPATAATTSRGPSQNPVFDAIKEVLGE